jgi:integration host factor subunit alpha
MSLTKINIVEAVYTHIGLPKADCARIVESLFDIIKDDLDKCNPVMISGFGKWTVNAKKARRGRNPKTWEGNDDCRTKGCHIQTV